MSDIKQVIVMRNDLGMRKGKMIAQGAHASMAFMTRKLATSVTPEKEIYGVRLYGAECNLTEPQLRWLESSFTKICVRVNSEEELMRIHLKCVAAGIPSNVITDNGTTEFGGIPTVTCCAVGPDYSEKIDKITGHLELL